MARTSSAMKKYDRATTAYLNNMEATGASACTIRNYATRLELFRQHWEERCQESHHLAQDPALSDFVSWRNELLATGKKPSTVRQYMQELKIFFGWASDPSMGESRFYKENPVSSRIIPNTRKADVRPYDEILTNDQIVKLWRNNPPSNHRGTPRWERNYAVVILLLTTELRNAELLDLRLCDLDFENSEITVESGKGNKFRVVDFPEIAQTAVKLYLQSGYRPQDASPQDVLFGTNGEPKERAGGRSVPWRRGSSQWLSSLVSRHIYNVTGVQDVRTHDLRHIGAKLDLNSGMSIEELQAKLGHSSINTTQIYSGRLTSRRSRGRTKDVCAERDYQAARNAAVLNRL